MHDCVCICYVYSAIIWEELNAYFRIFFIESENIFFFLVFSLGVKMNVQLELLEYNVQRSANAWTVENAIILVANVFVSQDIPEYTVKQGYVLK